MRLTEAVKLEKHIDNIIHNMDHSGQMWAEVQCYVNKTSTMQEAYIIGYIAALLGLKEYLSYNLDKSRKIGYTSRKAHKK